MRLAKHLSLFSIEFNKFRNTGVLRNVRFYLSFDTKASLKLCFYCKNVQIQCQMINMCIQ